MIIFKNLFFLSVLSGILLALGWPPLPLFPMIFLGFIPILFIENIIESNYKNTSHLQLFQFSYLAFLIWNALTTWWVCNASLPAGIFAIAANALLMCFPILLFHQTKKQLGDNIGYASLIFYWMGYEYLHHQWELTWTWLTLGNGLSMYPQVVQWYEYTGVFGGSLWILLVNIFIFIQINNIVKTTGGKSLLFGYVFKISTVSLLLIVFPVVVSVLIYRNYEEKSEKQIDVVIAQPNIDPYHDKFGGMTEEEQLNKLILISNMMLDSTVDYLVWPETAFGTDLLINEMEENDAIISIRLFIKNFPQLTLITGISAFKEYRPGEKLTPTARKFGNTYYDAFNSAIQVDNSENIPIYHKSKLVPGVERMPYPGVFKFLEKLTINMGGTSGSLATQDHRSVFFSHDSTGIAPVICFESIFADYLTEYVRNGGRAFFIMTNDGWWKNTPGYQQHLLYGRLSAIENRRDIARSANTGVSCFVNQRGDILQPTEFWKDAVIRGKINLNSGQTFFSKNGDFIGRTAAFVAVLLILVTFVSKATEKFKHRITRL